MDIAVGYGSYSQMLRFPNFLFYYCGHVTANGPSDHMEIPKNPLMKYHCELKAVSFMKLNLAFKFIT